MERTLLLVALSLWAAPCLAEEPSSPLASTLPIQEVTLFSSGVSYTERAGDVEGDATVPLLFRTAQINDILKSLVLIDRTGHVQPTTYASHDPIGHTLQSFAVDVTQNLTQEQILNRLRGATVTVESPGKGAITGQIVGVEQRQVAGEDGKPIFASFLNLLTAGGLTSVRLDTEKTIHLMDERLNREFREALGLLTTGSDEQRRQVTLHFTGAGRRQVRVGYVTEAPLWKMSYRLLLGGADKARPAAGTAYLQGWALVENTTDEDWKSIHLSLVSGRPVSFIQDLYQPLYIPRPVVGPDVVASPYPQLHEGDIAGRQAADRLALGGGGYSGSGAQGPPGAAGEKGDSGIADAASMAKSSSLANTRSILSDFNKSVISQAVGQRAGELFQYNIAEPVTLPRQQAAMIPVVTQDIGGEKLSIYNADTDARYPLNAVRIKNTTDLHLKAGPITLFDDGVYAGDAKMEDIPPGDSRLISYAVDTLVEGERQGPSQDTVQTTFSLKHGVLTITVLERLATTYTLMSKADKPRTVLVEHPFRADYKLMSPEKATERTPGLYRFALTVLPTKSQTLKVVTERPVAQGIAVVSADLNALGTYINQKSLSPGIRKALQEIVQRRRRVEDLQAQANGRDGELKSIDSDQERIRKNMGALDKSSVLYKRYVTELNTQETRLQSLRQEADRLRGAAAAAQADLQTYIDSLSLTD